MSHTSDKIGAARRLVPRGNGSGSVRRASFHSVAQVGQHCVDTPVFLIRQGMPAGGEQAFIPDRRGNRLDRYSFSVAPDRQSHRLYLRASPEIAGQFQSISSAALTYRLVGEHVPGAEGWTHCFRAPGVPDASIRELADLLSEVITLPRLSAVEFAIAMDWYKEGYSRSPEHLDRLAICGASS